MRPKNKKQQRILELSATLPVLTAKQEAYAFDKCIDKVGYLNKGQITCVGCNTIFQHDKNIKKHAVCPGCGDKIEIEKTRRQTFLSRNYFSIITTRKEFQVIRYFLCEQFSKYGKDSRSCRIIREAFQLWFTEDIKEMECVSLNRNVMGCVAFDAWIWGSKMEIRGCWPYQLRLINAVVWPKTRVLPLLRRNGFKTSTHGFAPAWLLRNLALSPMHETIFKAGYYNLLHAQDHELGKHWKSIKIAMRKNYRIEDVGMYIDYLDLLRIHNKDMRNPVYICPSDLKREHDKILQIERRKRRAAQARNARLVQIDLEKAEECYKKNKSRFFDIQFYADGITVKVLDSVKEFSKEGDILDHCVFTNKYYNKEKSLIMSARLGDEILETIEISLETFQLVQCRGLRNQISKYHDKIVSLVKQNIHQIIKKAS